MRIAPRKSRPRLRCCGWGATAVVLAAMAVLCGMLPAHVAAQVDDEAGPLLAARRSAVGATSAASGSDAARARGALAAGRFLSGRTGPGSTPASASMSAARVQHAAMVQAGIVQPRTSTLSAGWQPVGPAQVLSARYGTVTGRVSSIAIDPADASGNTVYVGTTGGGVWKSTNAAGAAGSVSFVPLTDTLPVFSGNSGTAATPSLSIGAMSAQAGGIVLAGTGDPNDALDSYYGGGILRSADGGLTWSLIQQSQDGIAGQHSFVGLGFAGFAWSTLSPNVVVAAVSQAAEGVLVNAPDALYSTMGLYYSRDAGVTWQMATIQDGSQIVLTPQPGGRNQGGLAATSVIWNAVRQRFYAAVRYHGYYESADGMTWTRMAHQPGTGLTMTACPTTTVGGSTGCPIYRGALAVQAATGDTFALTVDRYNVDHGLWQDVCGMRSSTCVSSTPMFGTQLNSAPLEAGGGSAVIAQADYNLGLAAVAQGTDTVLFVGTVDLYRCSLAGGCNLRNTTNAVNGCGAPARVAPAQHAIAALSSPAVLYLGNDSGLWRSTDNVSEQGLACSADDATHFDNLNGGLGSLAEVMSLAQDPTDATGLLAGLGASGTAMSPSGGGAVWPQVSAGEGATVGIDPVRPMTRYISTAAGVSIRECDNGSECTASEFAGAPNIGAAQVSTDIALLDAPWFLDPSLPSNVLIGTCRVWRGPIGDGTAWSVGNAISPMLGGPPNSTCDPTKNPFVRSIAAGGQPGNSAAGPNAGSEVIYAGLAGALDGGAALGGHVFATFAAQAANGVTPWADLSRSAVVNDLANGGVFNPGAFDISSIAVDVHDATGKTVYVTLMGFTGNGLRAPHVYGSTDGGAHWTNLNSNLPNAPANSVVVDPNDANTVYVATDTGVYVTTQITSCGGRNCWSVYGAGLPNAPVTQLAAAAGLPTGDGRVGELRAGTYGRGIWQIPLLTAAYPAQPTMALSPTSLTFAEQPAGTASAAQVITVTNTGNASLLVSRVAVTGDYATTNTCVGTAVLPGATCAVSVSFVPAGVGTRTGGLAVYANVLGGQATAVLSGSATASPDVTFTPTLLSFPDTVVNATSAVQNVAVSNLGYAAATLEPAVVTGDFRIVANTCRPTLAARTGCTVSVAFVPTGSGVRAGSLSMTSSAGTQTAAMSGKGTLPATDALSTVALRFAQQAVTTSSQGQQVLLTNSGDVPLTLIDARIASGEFAATSFCGTSLEPHSSCAISVTYVPKTVGATAGALTVSDQFRSQTVALAGTGIAPAGVSLLPSGGLGFGAVAVGTNSAAQTLTLTNNGGVPLNLGGAAVTGEFGLGPASTCGATVQAGASCNLSVVFRPVAGGARNGVLTLTDDAANSPQTIALDGVGVDFVLAANGSTTASIANGKSATFPLLVSSAPTVTGAAAFRCTGAPVNATCVVNPSSVPLGTTTVVTVTVSTGVSSSAAVEPMWTGRGYGRAMVAMLLPGCLLVWRRRGLVRAGALLAVVCMAGSFGCGSGRRIPVPGTGTGTTAVAVTPAGTYPITVTATSAGLSRSIGLTLTVQ